MRPTWNKRIYSNLTAQGYCPKSWKKRLICEIMQSFSIYFRSCTCQWSVPSGQTKSLFSSCLFAKALALAGSKYPRQQKIINWAHSNLQQEIGMVKFLSLTTFGLAASQVNSIFEKIYYTQRRLASRQSTKFSGQNTKLEQLRDFFILRRFTVSSPNVRRSSSTDVSPL